MTYTEQEAKDLVKEHSEKVEQWVKDARAQSKTLKALVNGDGFHEELIEHIEHLESQDRAEVRRKYSKDIRDLFHRVMGKRQNVFDANGGSEQINITSEKIKEEFEERLSNFKANKSLYTYLSENYFNLTDVDPNGIIMLEYKAKEDDFDLYPSYKSIEDIRYYKHDGQVVDYLVFEPKINKETTAKTWRFVDDKTDWTFLELSGTFTKVPNKTFEHPFGKVPAIILSEDCITGSEVRISPVNPILELSKDYARDKSVLTIYKFQKGNPIHWRYGDVKCKTCRGLGKVGDKTCTACDGKGQPKKQDVSDVYYIPIPKDDQPVLGDKIAGYSSPDLETWKQYKEDLRDAELLIEDTIWGTDKTHQSKQNSETATGRYIDIQPISNTLNSDSDVAEYVYNTLANWVLNFVDRTKDKNEHLYNRSFGRRYIIESPDVLMEKYGEAKKNGDNNTILDKLLEELILSKYKSDPYMQNIMLKKSKVEPYLHLSTKEVYGYFGNIEANKKVLFQKFWQDADKEKTAEQLITEFEEYFNINNKLKQNESSTKEEIID
jgi:hypothetical protein